MQARKSLFVALPFAAIVLLVTLPAGSSGLPVDILEDPPSEKVTAPPECPGQSWRNVRVNCKIGARGGAVGEYGGTPFAVFCDGDRTTESICVVGEEYGVRMSSESASQAVDCFFQGQSGAVNEACGDVRLTIN